MRCRASAIACFTSQCPGRRWPSHVRQAPRSATTSGSPDVASTPVLYLLEIAGELIEAVGVVAKQIALDEHVGHRPRAIARHARPVREAPPRTSRARRRDIYPQGS